MNKDVPENAVAIGIPARILKMRTPEEVEEWKAWVIKQGGVKF